MNVALLTVFPRFFEGPLGEGMIRIARRDGKLDVRVMDLRDHTEDVHRTTDDTMYGGGAGMVMKCGPILKAVDALPEAFKGRVLLTSARGKPFSEAMARDLAGCEGFTIVCGRYKGVDERVIPLIGAEEVSLGDFVLSGGEPAAVVMLDAAIRHVPGVLGDYDSAVDDSFHTGLLGYPVYTRPEECRGLRVPDVLLSGHHARIETWRREMMLRTTLERRPDLLDRADLDPRDRKFLASLGKETPSREPGDDPGGKGKDR